MTQQWLTKEDYLALRQAVLESEEGRELVDWVRSVRSTNRPADAEDLASRLIGTVITSGWQYQNGMVALGRVMTALQAGEPVLSVFKNDRKASAIEMLWRRRQELFASFQALRTEEEASNWCDSIPYVRGPAVRFQALRDLGAADVAKPDRHMLRIAEKAGLPKNFESMEELCQNLARLTGDSVGTVDMVLWYAASKGMIPGI